MSCLLRTIVGILFIASMAAAETITIVSPSTARTIQDFAPGAVDVTQTSNAATANKWDALAYEFTLPPPGYDGVTEELRQLAMVAGASFVFGQQMRIGKTPAPFAAGQWPTAELRTARSPAGTLLMTYTTTIDDAALAIWSHRLTPGQTASLAGKSGITELSFSDFAGVYSVRYRIPTIVRYHVTEGGN